MQDRKRGTDVQNRLLDSVGEDEGGMFREKSIETSILSRVKQITSPGWMQKCSGLVHWEDPEGWDGEGGRRGNQDGEVRVTVNARARIKVRFRVGAKARASVMLGLG